MQPTSASPGRVARNVLITVGLVALALLLWAGRDVLFILFFGLLVGIFFAAPTGWLEARGLNRVLALILVVVITFAAIAGFWIALWPTLSEQLSTVGREIPQAIDRAGDWLRSQYAVVAGGEGQGAGDEGPTPADLEEEVRDQAGSRLGSIAGGVLPVISTMGGALTGLLLVLVVGIYTAAGPGLYRRGLLRLLPPAQRERLDEALERSAHSLRRWMIGTAINMVLVGLLTFLGLWILDIPAALALAVIAGLFEFIPIVGPVLSAVPAIVLALTESPATALWVAGLYVVVQQIEGNVLTPLVMRGTVHIPPALTVLFQALMATVFGFLGLLLAVPLLAVVLVMTRTLYVEPLEAS